MKFECRDFVLCSGFVVSAYFGDISDFLSHARNNKGRFCPLKDVYAVLSNAARYLLNVMQLKFFPKSFL